MKKVVYLLICATLPITALAQNKSLTEPISNTSEVEKQRVWNLALVYGTQTDTSNDESYELSGINVQLSRTFQISEKFSTQTIAATNYSQGENSLDVYNTSTEYTGIHISQTLSYAVMSFKYPLKPFIGLGFGFGGYSDQSRITDSEISAEYGINRIDVDAAYRMTSTLIGIEVELPKNLSPFISYRVSNISFEDVNSKVDKNMQGFDTVDVGVDLEDVLSTRFTLGLNYRF